MSDENKNICRYSDIEILCDKESEGCYVFCKKRRDETKKEPKKFRPDTYNMEEQLYYFKRSVPLNKGK